MSWSRRDRWRSQADDFRLYGSARRLYHFHVDNAYTDRSPMNRADEPHRTTPPRFSATFDPMRSREIQRAAATGIYDIRGGGAKRKLPHFDDLLFLGASISRYPLEGYREKCGTDVVLGGRHAKKPIASKIPVTIAGMSFGALSGPAKEALGRGASSVGTSTTTGDGGMTGGGARAFLNSRSISTSVALRHESGRSAQGRCHRGGGGAGARSRAAAACFSAKRSPPRSRHAGSAGRASTSDRLPPSRLDRSRRSRDQDRGIARNHGLGKADLREGRRARVPITIRRWR